MLLWSLCFASAGYGVHLLLSGSGIDDALAGVARERAALKRVIALLHELEDTLAAGILPASSRWDALRGLPRPWGPLASESLAELRARGSSLLPTLKRLRALASAHESALAEARAKSAQALAQAFFCSLLVPVFGSALYFLLPSVEERATLWAALCVGAVALAGAGALWMLRLAEAARWGGVPASARPWALAAQCAGERFLSLVRSGNPPDLAWARAHALLQAEAPGLAAIWGASVWSSAEGDAGPGAGAQSPASLRPLAEAGAGLRKAVQTSLMEGRPCTERAEAALEALRQDLRAAAERELQLLGPRSLQPLFACVAPALFGLLGAGLWLSWEGVAGGAF